MMEDFKIDLFTFSIHYKLTAQCRDAIYIFLVRQNRTIDVVEFFDKLLIENKVSCKNLLHKEKWKEHFLESRDKKEMYRQLQKTFILYDNPSNYSWTNRFNHYYSPGHEEDVFRQTEMVVLNEPYELNYEIEEHRPLFRAIFAEIIEQTPNQIEFLHFHFKYSFSLSPIDYNEFLLQIERDGNLSELNLQILKQWVKDRLTMEQTAIGGKNERGTDSPFALPAIMRDKKLYAYLLQQLTKEEHGPWFDKNGNFLLGKAKGIKAKCAALLDTLISKSYFREDIVWTLPNKRSFISANFGLDVGTTTLKKFHKKLGAKLSFLSHSKELLKNT